MIRISIYFKLDNRVHLFLLQTALHIVIAGTSDETHSAKLITAEKEIHPSSTIVMLRMIFPPAAVHLNTLKNPNCDNKQDRI